LQLLRERSVRLAQKLQGFLQERIIKQALRPDRPFRLPLALRLIAALPGLRGLPARVLGLGIWPSRLQK
jgi:hypothetical protein